MDYCLLQMEIKPQLMLVQAQLHFYSRLLHKLMPHQFQSAGSNQAIQEDAQLPLTNYLETLELGVVYQPRLKHLLSMINHC